MSQLDLQGFIHDNTPFIKDVAERAAKTFAGGFIVGAHLTQAAGTVLAGEGQVALSKIDWLHGLDIGAGTTAASLIFSIASLKVGAKGLASLTSAVQKAPRRSGGSKRGE